VSEKSSDPEASGGAPDAGDPVLREAVTEFLREHRSAAGAQRELIADQWAHLHAHRSF
jgi:hypothetical protein